MATFGGHWSFWGPQRCSQIQKSICMQLWPSNSHWFKGFQKFNSFHIKLKLENQPDLTFLERGRVKFIRILFLITKTCFYVFSVLMYSSTYMTYNEQRSQRFWWGWGSISQLADKSQSSWSALVQSPTRHPHLPDTCGLQAIAGI